jgi:hypothetical protein
MIGSMVSTMKAILTDLLAQIGPVQFARPLVYLAQAVRKAHEQR